MNSGRRSPTASDAVVSPASRSQSLCESGTHAAGVRSRCRTALKIFAGLSLTLPNVLAASARHGISRRRLCHLFVTDWTWFVPHNFLHPLPVLSEHSSDHLRSTTFLLKTLKMAFRCFARSRDLDRANGHKLHKGHPVVARRGLMPGLRDSGYSTNGCAQATGRQGIGREPEGVLMPPKAVWGPVYGGFDLAIYYKTRLANSTSSTMQCGTPARLHTTSAATRGIDSRAINLFMQKPLTEVPLTLIYERAAKLFPQKCSRSKGRV
jgi:hypothetical protein